MTGGADNLPKGFLYIIVIVVEIPLPGHIDSILVRFVMGHSAAVVTDGDKAVFHLQQKIIEADMQLPVVRFRIAPFRHTAVLPQCGFIGWSVNILQGGLVYVEEGAHFPVMHALVMFPVLFVQSEIGCAADDLFRIVPVDISVPVVEKERHAPLMLPDGHTHRFGFIIMNEKI